jgi:hypothetical protein
MPLLEAALEAEQDEFSSKDIETVIAVLREAQA